MMTLLLVVLIVELLSRWRQNVDRLVGLLSSVMVTSVGLYDVGGRTMVLFAKCLLLFSIVVLVVTPWYGDCNCLNLVHDCCTVVVFVALCGGGEVDKIMLRWCYQFSLAASWLLKYCCGIKWAYRGTCGCGGMWCGWLLL